MTDSRLLLSDQTSLDLVKAAQTSAGTEVDSDYVDMENYDGVRFFCTIATANAGNYIKVQQDADGSGTGDDLEGSKVVATTNGNVVKVEVMRPIGDRYLRAVIIRAGANTATGDMYAERYSTRTKPASDAAEVEGIGLVSPAEGTA